jgi:UDP-glucose 4-epimerase
MAAYLVTGGAGFIGSHLVEGLFRAGHTVRVLDNLSTGRRENLAGVAERVELIEGSITDPRAVAAAVDGVRAVFHLAALPSVQRSVEDPLSTHEVCARGTLEVLDACRRAGVRRVVYAASSSAYGDTPGTVRVESDPVSPLSPYAAAKLAGEHYCRCYHSTYGLETVRLRFFNIFGPRQRADSPYSGVIALFIGAMAAGRRPTVLGDGLQSRDFTYVGNAVQALLRAADSPRAVGNVYNVGTGGGTSVLELIGHLNRLLGTGLSPIHAAPRPGDVRHSCADVTLAREHLEYEPAVSFPEGLGRTVEAHLMTAVRW